MCIVYVAKFGVFNCRAIGRKNYRFSQLTWNVVVGIEHDGTVVQIKPSLVIFSDSIAFSKIIEVRMLIHNLRLTT